MPWETDRDLFLDLKYRVIPKIEGDIYSKTPGNGQARRDDTRAQELILLPHYFNLQKEDASPNLFDLGFADDLGKCAVVLRA